MAMDLMVALVNSQVMQAGGKSGANLFPGRLDQPHDDIVALPGRGQFRHRAALDGVRLLGEAVEGAEPFPPVVANSTGKYPAVRRSVVVFCADDLTSGQTIAGEEAEESPTAHDRVSPAQGQCAGASRIPRP
jgi:hypothetical protein